MTVFPYRCACTRTTAATRRRWKRSTAASVPSCSTAAGWSFQKTRRRRRSCLPCAMKKARPWKRKSDLWPAGRTAANGAASLRIPSSVPQSRPLALIFWRPASGMCTAPIPWTGRGWTFPCWTGSGQLSRLCPWCSTAGPASRMPWSAVPFSTGSQRSMSTRNAGKPFPGPPGYFFRAAGTRKIRPFSS